MPRIALLSTSDTDLLSARASASDWKLGNPYRVGADQLAAFADGTDLVVTAAITKDAVDELGLTVGASAYALVKATEVQIAVD